MEMLHAACDESDVLPTPLLNCFESPSREVHGLHIFVISILE